MPAVEQCDTPADESCDGIGSCTGNPLWSKRFGDAGFQEVAFNGMAPRGGGVVLCGSFDPTVDFGGAPLVTTGSSEIFVAALDARGGHLWSKAFGGKQADRARACAADAQGNVVVTGFIGGTADFGGGPIVSAGGFDVFAVKLAQDGKHLWSKRFGDASEQGGWDVAVDEAGNVVVVGYFAGTIDFGGTPLTSAGDSDAFVAKLDPAGTHVWSKRFGDASGQQADSVAVDAGGNVVVSGLFHGTVDFGGTPLTSAGGGDVFAVKLAAADGAHLWSKRFGDAAPQYRSRVAVDAGGNVLVAGELAGTIDFGGTPLVSAGGSDAFLAKLDPAGSHLWSKRFGDGADGQWLDTVAADALGNVVVGGSCVGSVDFGGGPLVAEGSFDAVVGKLAPDGAHLWSKRFGGPEDAYGHAAVDALGGVWLAGTFAGAIDLGKGSLASAGGYDIFLAKLAP
jgi:hypothetical protein